MQVFGSRDLPLSIWPIQKWQLLRFSDHVVTWNQIDLVRFRDSTKTRFLFDSNIDGLSHGLLFYVFTIIGIGKYVSDKNKQNVSQILANFPFINIPTSPAYGIYISQLICYSRVCAQYSDFLDRAQLLTQWLLITRLRYRGWPQVFATAKQFLLLIRHPPCSGENIGIDRGKKIFA
jgi:hypothetical protein